MGNLFVQEVDDTMIIPRTLEIFLLVDRAEKSSIDLDACARNQFLRDAVFTRPEYQSLDSVILLYETIL